MNQKNDSIESLATASLMTVASELFSNHHIITLSEGAKYTFQTIFMTLLHAATSVNNSLESASNDLKLKSSITKIPSADTIFNYINFNNVEYILSSFRAMNRDIFKSINIGGKVHDIAIDFAGRPLMNPTADKLLRLFSLHSVVTVGDEHIIYSKSGKADHLCKLLELLGLHSETG